MSEEIKDIGETSDGYHTFNELYEHRHQLFRIICEQKYGWKSKIHSDGSFLEGWFIAGLNHSKGKQITYHIPIKYWDEFDVNELERAPEWDGHTSNDVLNRLRKL